MSCRCYWGDVAQCGDVSDDPEFKNKNKWGRRWNIPKGHVEEGESLEKAALREFTEETSLPITLTRFDDLKYLGKSYTSSGKEVHIFAYEQDFAPKSGDKATYRVPIKSNMCEVTENGKTYQVPEMAEAFYWKIEAAERMIFSYQKVFLTNLKAELSKKAPAAGDEEISEQADGGAAVGGEAAPVDGGGDGGATAVMTTTEVFGPETTCDQPVISDKDKEANEKKPINITNILIPTMRGGYGAYPLFRRYSFAPPRPPAPPKRKTKKRNKRRKKRK